MSNVWYSDHTWVKLPISAISIDILVTTDQPECTVLFFAQIDWPNQ